jgi:signal transduction histidine kinase/CheY-like chemotaxis protein/HAMP domain-containing protein
MKKNIIDPVAADSIDPDVLLKMLVAYKNGDFTVRLPNNITGLNGEIANTLNDIFASTETRVQELERISEVVGKQGKVNQRISITGTGGWKKADNSINALIEDLTRPTDEISKVLSAVSRGELTDNVNTMSTHLATQQRNIASEKNILDHIAADSLDPQILIEMLMAYKNGDFSVRLPNNITGLSGKIADTLNEIISMNQKRIIEFERINDLVGKQGKFNQRLDVTGIGAWKVAGSTINLLIENITRPTYEITRVINAVAKGDFTQTIPLEIEGEKLQGEFLHSALNMNKMMGQLNSFLNEVILVAREAGKEGKLGGYARIDDISGLWKDLTDSVNALANNLTNGVRNISDVTIAVTKGDFSKRITVDVHGELLELKNTINDMIERLLSFITEVNRVVHEVGTEGKLGEQAIVPGALGIWKELADNINSMTSNFTNGVHIIASVTSAVAKGDLNQKITLNATGEFLTLKTSINTMVDQLNAFALQIIRVAKEVGTDGKLGGLGIVPGVSGTWKVLTDSVNAMADNLTIQVRNIAEVTTAVANGDLTKKITIDAKGEFLELKNTINTMVGQLNAFASELTRVAYEVGSEGKLGGQAKVKEVSGTWKDLTEKVNVMTNNLTGQVRNIADITTAVAKGDLSKKIMIDAKGEFLELKNTINTMVDRLNSFASEVTRVAREVGTEGKLGGQAIVRGVDGTWKDLTDSVNLMAYNLTDQVRNISKVITSVANGDLTKKFNVQAKGEIAELADIINGMVDTLALFADQVTGVAREVGVEGKLGGQATVPGASGTWSELIYNVNQLASNLSTQVRAIGEVVTAVTKGDLTRSIQLAARGEVEELKNNINEMITNLRETTLTNSEQDWLKTNVARFTLMLQGQRDLLAVAQLTLSELARLVNAQLGIFFISEDIDSARPKLKMLSSYAFKNRENLSDTYYYGEGIVGQCAIEKQQILINNVPGDYIRITSGLGEARPLNIIALPIIFEGTVKAVIELASFEKFSNIHKTFLDQLSNTLGIIFNTIESGSRTEELLKQSQSLALELQSQQQELQQSNEDLEGKALLLSEQNAEVERKNRQIDIAHKALEEKAAQLALTSKYKSEFLSNMSHELRTPLNSLLILSQQLAENREGNLTKKQVKYAKTIRSSGNDLLFLINDILDLAKIESGTVTLDPTDVSVKNMCEEIERNFRHIANTKELKFTIETEKNLPDTIYTDSQRTQQIIKNLLSNAFKFTTKGSVTFSITHAVTGWSSKSKVLSEADMVIAFAVSDTGFGIPPRKLKIIFEAFQQADGSTSRRFGGTGLGLSISRELANLLGGEITVSSLLEKGSTFTLYLPVVYHKSVLQENQSPKETITSDLESLNKTIKSSSKIIVNAKSPLIDSPVNDSSIVLPEVNDDRNNILEGDKVIVIIEDDFPFAQILIELAHEKEFKVITTTSGEEGIKLVKQYRPVVVTLDIFLPDTEGWIVLDRLKLDRETRYIPIYVISVDDQSELSLHRGASAHFIKPVTRKALEIALDKISNFIERETKKLLIVEGNPTDQNVIKELVGSGDVEILIAGTGEEALAILEKEQFDCMIIDLTLPGISGFAVIEIIRENEVMKDLPIIIYTIKELSQSEKEDLQKYAREIIIKDVRSPIKLLDEVNLFLHRKTKNIPEDKMAMLEKLYNADIRLEGKKALIVDDDIRNIFALTSVLERYNMEVISAENGKDAIQVLTKNQNIDFVLMDIMMPEMDGYETMSHIRKKLKMTSIPIIALTAKAMKGDREKCILAGASDYISKPINTEQLLSLLRVWLFK